MTRSREELKVAYLTDGASEFDTLYEQHLKMPLGADVVAHRLLARGRVPRRRGASS